MAHILISHLTYVIRVSPSPSSYKFDRAVHAPRENHEMYIVIVSSPVIKPQGGISCYYPFQIQNNDASIFTLLPRQSFMTFRGNSCPSIRPSLSSESQLNSVGPNWQSEKVECDVAHS